MDEPIIAMIALFGFNFAPYGWVFCNGSLYSIAQNAAAFSLVGTAFGGNGQSTFAVPDLRGRAPIGIGQYPGLTNYVWGQMGGAESVTLISSQMPVHTHVVTNTLTVIPKASTQAGTTTTPGLGVVPSVLPTIGAGVNTYPINGYGTTADTNLAPASITGDIIAAPAGNSMPFSIMQPYIAMNYCFAMEGIYPSRS